MLTSFGYVRRVIDWLNGVFIAFYRKKLYTIATLFWRFSSCL